MNKKTKNILTNIIQIILVAIIIFSIYKIGTYYYQNYKNTQIINNVQNIVEQIESENTPLDGGQEVEVSETNKVELSKTQLDQIAIKTIERLKQENADVKAYVKMLDFGINNPVTYRHKDNDYYLYRDLEENYSTPGTLFINGWSDPEFKDMNTTIFGHNLRVGDNFAPMFKQLLTFEDEEVVKSKDEHIIEIYTDQGYKKYKVFSAYYSTTFNDYIKSNREKDVWVEYLESLEDESIHDFKFDPEFTEDTKILTLSTCDEVRGDNKGRFVVQAIEIEVV